LYKALLGLSFAGIAIYFWGRVEQSVIIQMCGFALAASMFTVFMMRKRHS
jgi:hypothetical protein